MCFWIALFFLIALLIATLPVYPYSRTWGYYPGTGILVLVLLVLLLWWLAIPPFYYAPAEPMP